MGEIKNPVGSQDGKDRSLLTTLSVIAGLLTAVTGLLTAIDGFDIANPFGGSETPPSAQHGEPGVNLPDLNFDAGVGDPTLRISTLEGPPGTTLTVSGQGFAPGEEIEISLHLEVLATIRADTDGAFFEEPITIPSDWQFKGQFRISADGSQSLIHLSRPFEVT